MSKMPSIIVDLDGTLCDDSHRRLRIEGKWGPEEYKKYYEAMGDDRPRQWCRDLVRTYLSLRHKIFFVTGRPEEYRRKTEYWLFEKCGINPNFHYELFMRPTGDFNCDTDIKKRIYLENIEPDYDVIFILEDRDRVVKMWRELGLTCLQVQEGNF